MRTSVTLDESLVRELRDLSGEKTKTAAVEAAVKEQIRRAKLNKLAGLLGRIDVDEEAIKRARRRDLERVEWLTGIGAKKRGRRH
ncbi:MAG: type II toxin-antitoxin system VapB family antitoxin [Acidobacteria bacterium]|nr:type II toxin-antitoxin system VapB family antitoxin [Acidobacteriota bacterium]